MRIPLSLSVYEHAARLIGATPWEASRDPELLYRAHAAAYETYRHTPVVVGIDIYNLEAEAYGCAVDHPGGAGIPAITRPRYRSVEEALDIPPLSPAWGRIPSVLDTAARLQGTYPDADVRVPVSGPFSIAQSLVGLEPLMLAAALDPGPLRRLLERLADGQLEVVRAAQERHVGIAFFESAAAPPLLSPAQFEAIELPALQRAMQGTAAILGRPVPCIIGGNTLPILPAILATGTRFVICPAETDRVRFLAAMEGHPEVTVRVNLNPGLYTRGTLADIAREVDEVVRLARGRAHVLLGTGAIPYETPVANLLFLRRYAEGTVDCVE